MAAATKFSSPSWAELRHVIRPLNQQQHNLLMKIGILISALYKFIYYYYLLFYYYYYNLHPAWQVFAFCTANYMKLYNKDIKFASG